MCTTPQTPDGYRGRCVTRRWIALIFGVSLTIRLGLVAVDPTVALAHRHEGINVAESLAAGKGFSNPYCCPTGPTAHLAPGYPTLLGGLFRIFPTSVWRGAAMGVIASTATSVAWALLPLLALQLGAPLPAGVAAGLFGAFFPMLPGLEARGAWEAPITTLLVVTCTMLTIRFTRSARWGHAAAAGLAWGAAFWFGPNLLPICAVWVAFCLLDSTLRFRSGAMLVVSMLVISPWILRNWREFGHIFWVRDTLGLELSAANNSGAAAAPLDDSAGGEIAAVQERQRRAVAWEFHPHANPAACEKVQAMGEFAYMQEQQRRAVTWIRGHPWDFLRLTGQHIWYFWLPAVPFFRRVLSGCCGLLGVAGLVISWRYGWRTRAALTSGLVVYPLLYYFVQAISRYRQPVQPLIALSAALALEPLRRWATARWFGGKPPSREAAPSVHSAASS
jgi:4-amino-4-deoxy-L-arabinose transferase-like glycosyltransferase